MHSGETGAVAEVDVGAAADESDEHIAGLVFAQRGGHRQGRLCNTRVMRTECHIVVRRLGSVVGKGGTGGLCACVRACVRACVCVCVRVCVCVGLFM